MSGAAVLSRSPTYRQPLLVIGAVGLVSALLIGVAASLGVVPGLLALAAVPVALLVLRRPDLGAYLLIALVPVTSGFRRGLPVPALRLSELLIAGVAALILLSADRERSRQWRIFDWLALAYAGANLGLGLSQLLVRDEQLVPDVVGTLVSPFQYLLLYRAVIIALPEPAQFRLALRLLLLGSVPVSLAALLQYFDLLGVRGLIPTVTGTDIDKDFPWQEGARATGTFPHWQVLGAYEFWIVLLGVAVLLERRSLMRPWAVAAVLGLAVGALFTTVTLTVILAAVAGAIALGVWYGRIDVVAPALVIGGAVAVLAFGGAFERRLDEQFDDQGTQRPAWMPRTMEYRYRLWRDQYVPVVSGSRYLTGYGPDDPPNLTFAYTESLYVTLVTRGGIPLLLIYAALTLALLAAAVRARDEREPSLRGAARVTAVGLVLLVPMHFVEPYFVFTGMAPLLWIAAAMTMRGRAARTPSLLTLPRPLPTH